MGEGRWAKTKLNDEINSAWQAPPGQRLKSPHSKNSSRVIFNMELEDCAQWQGFSKNPHKYATHFRTGRMRAMVPWWQGEWFEDNQFPSSNEKEHHKSNCMEGKLHAEGREHCEWKKKPRASRQAMTPKKADEKWDCRFFFGSNGTVTSVAGLRNGQSATSTRALAPRANTRRWRRENERPRAAVGNKIPTAGFGHERLHAWDSRISRN